MKIIFSLFISICSLLAISSNVNAEEISLKNRAVLTPKTLFDYKKAVYDPYTLTVLPKVGAKPTFQGYPVLGFGTQEVRDWVGCCAGYGMTVVLLADTPQGNKLGLNNFAKNNKCLVNPTNAQSDKELWGGTEGAITASGLTYKEGIIEQLKTAKRPVPKETINLVCWNED